MSFAVRSDPAHDATEGSFLDFLNENDDADVKPGDYTLQTTLNEYVRMKIEKSVAGGFSQLKSSKA